MLVIFCFQTSLKAARPETILFYINNADIQAVANCVPSMQIATDQRSQLNSSENRLRNDSEKSSVYTNRRKGKNAAQTSPFFYSQQNDQQQVWEPGAQVAVLPCCRAVPMLLEQTQALTLLTTVLWSS